MINQQSLKVHAPSDSSQFSHFVSLASTSKNENQRRDALSFLSSQISSLPTNHEPPLSISILLTKLLPLILDGSTSVRAQLLRFLHVIPKNNINCCVENALLYTRAGMTHLSVEIRIDALEVLEWLLEVAQEDIVSCPGGWVKILKCFMNIMGWVSPNDSSKWSFETTVSFGKFRKAYPKQLVVFAKFIRAGLIESEFSKALSAKKISERLNRNAVLFPIVDLHLNMIPRISNPYSHLNLFGAPRDEESELYTDRKARQKVFYERFLSDIYIGVEKARKEGGEIGRAAAILEETLKQGMSDYKISK